MKNMLRKSVVAAAVVAALGISGQALALGTIQFDRDGLGGNGAIFVDTFQWTGDNVLLQNLIKDTIVTDGAGNIVDQAQTFLGNTFTLRMQSSLGSFKSDSFSNIGAANCPTQNIVDNNSICNAIGSSEFTFQLDIPMIVTSAVKSGTGPKWELGFAVNGAANSAVGNFSIFYDTTPDAVDLTGAGFGDTNLGTGAILTGAVVVNANSNGNFTMDQANSLSKQDTNGTDNNSNVGTYSGGNGAIQFDIKVLTQNFDFFISDLRNTVIPVGMNLTSNTNTPLSNVNPTTGAAGVVGAVPNYGSNTRTGDFDGAGPLGSETRLMDDLICGPSNPNAIVDETVRCDLLLQGQGQDAFFNPVNVPEPGSLALLGLGFGVMGYAGRRRRQLLQRS